MQRPKWWQKGIRFECQGSGKCCSSRGQYGYVYLTEEDRSRLAKELNLSTSEFTKTYCEQHDGFFHLKEESEQVDCRFLKNNRCSVYSARPTQCRTWPFWPENMAAKAWSLEVATFCPGVGKGAPVSKELISQNIDEQKASENELNNEARNYSQN